MTRRINSQIRKLTGQNVKLDEILEVDLDEVFDAIVEEVLATSDEHEYTFEFEVDGNNTKTKVVSPHELSLDELKRLKKEVVERITEEERSDRFLDHMGSLTRKFFAGKNESLDIFLNDLTAIVKQNEGVTPRELVVNNPNRAYELLRQAEAGIPNYLVPHLSTDTAAIPAALKIKENLERMGEGTLQATGKVAKIKNNSASSLEGILLMLAAAPRRQKPHILGVMDDEGTIALWDRVKNQRLSSQTYARFLERAGEKTTPNGVPVRKAVEAINPASEFDSNAAYLVVHPRMITVEPFGDELLTLAQTYEHAHIILELHSKARTKKKKHTEQQIRILETAAGRPPLYELKRRLNAARQQKGLKVKQPKGEPWYETLRQTIEPELQEDFNHTYANLPAGLRPRLRVAAAEGVLPEFLSECKGQLGDKEYIRALWHREVIPSLTTEDDIELEQNQCLEAAIRQESILEARRFIVISDHTRSSDRRFYDAHVPQPVACYSVKQRQQAAEAISSGDVILLMTKAISHDVPNAILKPVKHAGATIERVPFTNAERVVLEVMGKYRPA